MNENELAMRFYDSARAEMMERIKLRENIILFYVGAVATLLGVVFGKEGANSAILFVIPLLSLAAAILVSHHNSLIGALGLYCSVELNSSLQASTENKIIQWDESRSLITGSSKAIRSRLIPHLLIISAPAVIALIVNHQYLTFAFTWESITWLVGSACFLSSVYYICQSGLDRKANFNEIEIQSNS